jgi:hypothetical protein
MNNIPDFLLSLSGSARDWTLGNCLKMRLSTSTPVLSSSDMRWYFFFTLAQRVLGGANFATCSKRGILACTIFLWMFLAMPSAVASAPRHRRTTCLSFVLLFRTFTCGGGRDRLSPCLRCPLKPSTCINPFGAKWQVVRSQMLAQMIVSRGAFL